MHEIAPKSEKLFDSHRIIQQCYSQYLRKRNCSFLGKLLAEKFSEVIDLHYLAILTVGEDASVSLISAAGVEEELVRTRFIGVLARNSGNEFLSESDFYCLAGSPNEAINERYFVFEISEALNMKGVLALCYGRSSDSLFPKQAMSVLLRGLSDILFHHSISIERSILDNELLSNREELLAALNSLNGAILLVDDQLIIQNVLGKKYHLAGKPLFDLMGKSVSVLGNKLLRAVIKVKNSNHPASIEYSVEAKNAVKCFQIHINVISRKDGIQKLALLITDITPLKNTQKRLSQNVGTLEEVNKVKTKLISIITHEFLNPLSIVSTSVEMLELHLRHLFQNEEPFRERFSIIYGHIKMINDMIQNFSLMNKLENIKLMSLSKFRLTEVVEHIATDFRLIYGAQIEVRCNLYRREEPELTADILLIKNIFINLFNNAIKYSPEHPQLRTVIDYDEAGVNIMVSDKGIGISPTDLPHIFESYYRGKNVRSVSGSGLGLPIVKSFIEMHGGNIRVSSKEGMGTSIIIFLPFLHDAPLSIIPNV